MANENGFEIGDFKETVRQGTMTAPESRQEITFKGPDGEVHKGFVSHVPDASIDDPRFPKGFVMVTGGPFGNSNEPVDISKVTEIDGKPPKALRLDEIDKLIKKEPPQVGDGVIVRHNETGEARAGKVVKVFPHQDVIHVKNPDGSITDLHLKSNADHFRLVHGGPAVAADIVEKGSRFGGVFGRVFGMVAGPLIVAGATLASGGGFVAAAEAGIKTAGDQIMEPIEVGAKIKEEASKGNWKEAGIEAARYFDPGFEAQVHRSAELRSVVSRLPLSPEVMTLEFMQQNPELVAMSIAHQRALEIGEQLAAAEKDPNFDYNKLNELRYARAEATEDFRSAYGQFQEEAENQGRTVSETVQATLGDKTPEANIAQKQPEQGSSVDRAAGAPSTIPVGGGGPSA